MWMAVIDAAIQGVPEQAQRRRETINHQFSLRVREEGGGKEIGGREREKW